MIVRTNKPKHAKKHNYVMGATAGVLGVALVATVGIMAGAQSISPEDVAVRVSESESPNAQVGTDAEFTMPVNGNGEEVTTASIQKYLSDKEAAEQAAIEAEKQAAIQAEQEAQAKAAAEAAAAQVAQEQAQNQTVYTEEVSYDSGYSDDYYYEESYSEPVYSDGGGSSSGGGLTREGGVYHNPDTGLRETWYSDSENTGYFYIPDPYVGDDGIYRDGDGYIVVASQDYSKGTVIDTSHGEGKVYDYCGIPGTVDLYVSDGF